jgi:hypothetical protein
MKTVGSLAAFAAFLAVRSSRPGSSRACSPCAPPSRRGAGGPSFRAMGNTLP